MGTDNKLILFKIRIDGLFCAVPNKHRTMELTVDNNEITDRELLIILNEAMCKMTLDKRRVTKFDNKKFEQFHLGKRDDKAKTTPIKIEIFGKYSDEPNPERIILVKNNTLFWDDFGIVMYENLCLTRNRLSETMSREDMSKLADKYKIHNLGMLPDEDPFETR